MDVTHGRSLLIAGISILEVYQKETEAGAKPEQGSGHAGLIGRLAATIVWRMTSQGQQSKAGMGLQSSPVRWISG